MSNDNKKTSKSQQGKTVTTKIGRDARTGEFIPVKEAQRRKSTAVVETVKRTFTKASPNNRDKGTKSKK